MTNTKKVLVALLAVLCLCAVAFAGGSKEEIKIIYTNDVHCGYVDGVGYSAVAALKAQLEAEYGEKNVLLVDNGDAIQGDAIGTVSDGKYIVDIMNKVGYDLAIFGNHEFDYGLEKLVERVSESNATYLNANLVFTGSENDVNLLGDTTPYKIINFKGTKVAFIGVSTAETKYKSTPRYFMNEAGEWIYDFLDGEELYRCIQGYVNKVRKAGADYVVLLTHMGDVRETEQAIATDLIANTYGVDVVLDGHSHSTVEYAYVKNAVGKDVVYTQTGTKLANVGVLTIVPGEGCYARLYQPTEKDADVDAFIKAIDAEYLATLEAVVATSSIELSTNNAEGARAVRNRETAIGDLCADAYRAVSGADVAFVNGGGIRASIAKGDLTYKNVISIHPYGNMLCMCEATGQEILDALEWGSKSTTAIANVGSNAQGESGGFLQVSGLKYTIDTKVPSHVVADSDGMFVGVDGERRVKDVYVGSDETGWTPIDPAKTYTLACHNYKLQDMGDGYTMFVDNNYLIDKTMIDNQVLITYIRDYLGGVIGSEYAKPQGRITVK